MPGPLCLEFDVSDMRLPFGPRTYTRVLVHDLGNTVEQILESDPRRWGVRFWEFGATFDIIVSPYEHTETTYFADVKNQLPNDYFSVLDYGNAVQQGWWASNRAGFGGNVRSIEFLRF